MGRVFLHPFLKDQVNIYESVVWSHLLLISLDLFNKERHKKVRGQAVGGCNRAVLSWHVLPWHWVCSPICLRVPGMVAVPGVWPEAGGKCCSKSHGQLRTPSPTPPRLVAKLCSSRGETLKAWTFLFGFVVKMNVDMSEMPLDWKWQVLAFHGREAGLWT